MPVTAQFSKRFYEALGEDVARELVDWFNQVDATYRSDLNRHSELIYGRFEARLEQRIVELSAKMEIRISGLEARLTSEIGRLEQRMDHRFAESDARMEKALAAQRAELIKWMFIFFMSSAIAVIGLG